MQGRNRDTDIENGHVGPGEGAGEAGMNWESSPDIYTPPGVKWIARGWEGGSRGGDTGVLTADSCGCTTETHTTLSNNYIPKINT